jgi:hypothetical protein
VLWPSGTGKRCTGKPVCTVWGGADRKGLREQDLAGRLLHWLLGFAGPRAEAEAIKDRLRSFLRDRLKLELSDEKTLITHAHDKAARFRGYDISSMHADSKLDHRGRRSVNGHIMLKVPWEVIVSLCSRYEERGKPAPRPSMLDDTDFSIVGR